MMSLVNKKFEINGNRIYLRVLEVKDATQEYCDWLNDPEVNKYLETKGATIEGLKEYINEKNKSSNCLFFGIFYRENDEHIGNLKLEPIDFDSKRATFGILIGDKKYWGMGIGVEVTKLIVDWAFDILNLKEVNLGVIAENKAAVKIYEKVGFHIDNIEKKSIKSDNKFYDKITMSIKR